jgi:hypothetical protein
MLAFRARRAKVDSPLFGVIVALLMAITIPTIPSSIAVYNQILLVPAIFWLFSRKESIPRILGWTVGSLIGWQWIAASGLALVSLLYPAIRNIAWVLVLPLRTASAVPFAVIALCLWMIWRERISRQRDMDQSALSISHPAREAL